MRYINEIYTTPHGTAWTNQALLAEFEGIIATLPLEGEEQTKLWDFVRFQLVGERTRYSVLEDWTAMKDFRSRASAFETGAEQALDRLAAQIAPAAERAGITFDAVLTTTATGNLMPGLSYRLAQRLGGLVGANSTMVDLGNVGCTGSVKLLNLAQSLDAAGIGPIQGGTLYPVLLRLQRGGLITAQWREGAGGPARKYYRITDDGRAALHRGGHDWQAFVTPVTAIVTGGVDG